MTTRVLISNFGPDRLLVRAVQYGPEDLGAAKPATVIADTVVLPGEHVEQHVHTNQQLLIGEKRA